jgi:hypothetical protein
MVNVVSCGSLQIDGMSLCLISSCCSIQYSGDFYLPKYRPTAMRTTVPVLSIQHAETPPCFSLSYTSALKPHTHTPPEAKGDRGTILPSSAFSVSMLLSLVGDSE